ncbi:MAG: acyl-CoA dehydratase activase-related protein [Bryobacteraceae bacterium]|nr:acyl-CoA dehydratase activase-related protein [Bryobacteraceae bacterium]MDW8378908.1 BadF/BadG/BcrA/BcrD ATPase family protein [Bryobacterales bacterium]
MERKFMIGMDVGSTTVKAVVVDVATDQIIWRDYQRHDTKQPEKCLEFLKRFEEEIDGFQAKNARLFITGSGGSGLGKYLGAKFVQEVNAVSLAVEKLYPEAGSVIELGGQDAKIIIFKEDPETGRKKKIPSMNDKCAGGTGAVIDKINAKLRIPPEKLCQMGYKGLKLHPVAGKCGVFAETDINGLQKSGVPADELMASLFEAIVMQNLSVLTRGNTLRPVVLLLGGPNTYIVGMRDCWKHNIPKIWEERKYPLPEGVPPEDLIRTPENAQYFAAIGAVEFGKTEDEHVGQYLGYEKLQWYIEVGRDEEKKKKGGGGGLAKSEAELEAFKAKYRHKKFVPATFQPGEIVEGFIGIDGGSTSTKAVLLSKDKERRVLAKAYQLSKGNPIEDSIEIFAKLEKQIADQGATLKVLGVGTTGYAKDILKDVMGADAAVVETVAHTQAGLHFYKNVDVICDVGGQDIKIIILKNGRVKDFKLNTQCSAGNGYFLQSTAQGFGYPVEQFADVAFSATGFPQFGYGCAVFMQSDIVDFQRQGWKPEEIMAGLCNVLPKNIWLYVSQIPNLAAIGSTFLLQGGTQYNLAAVKAQVDFIESRFKGKEQQPTVIVHEHCGEAGAIGAALEAGRLWDNGRQSTFIGLEAVGQIQYKTTRNEQTRCYFCKNKCLRTFIDVKTSVLNENAYVPKKSKVPLEEGSQRLIIATCEKGTVEDINEMRTIKGNLDKVKKENPNFVEIAARQAFKVQDVPIVADPLPKFAFTAAQKRRIELMKRRSELRIGMPRVLNMYSQAPVFTGYFASLGIKPEHMIWSDYTSETLYKEGAKRGAIDPCFPSKLGIPHVHNLLYVHHAKKRLDIIFFPMIDCLTSDLTYTQASRACPTVAATPAAVKAAFTKEGDLFKEKGVLFLDTFVNISKPDLFERQMYEQFKDILGLSPEENARAIREGYKALHYFNNVILRGAAREVLEQLEREDRLGVVLLGRPYHNDPGVNHEILEEFQKLGYPVFTQDSLPIDDDIVWRLFGDEVNAGEIPHPLAVTDVWKNSYSENTTRKVWAAKYVARHPNLVALELSSFKCGHDAPIYTVVEEIVEHSGTPYFCFKDIDENKPTGSIKIRTETIAYFLKRYREDMVVRRKKMTEIERKLAEFEQRLRRQLLKEKLDRLNSDEAVKNSLDQGAMPQIHVSLSQLAQPAPRAQAQGD